MDLGKEKSECNETLEEKVVASDLISSETENKAEIQIESETIEKQSPKADNSSVEENIVKDVNEEIENKLEEKNAISKEEDIDLHKSVESILSESDGEEAAQKIEEEAAEESAYEEELIEDTDPEDRDSENAVVLSSDDEEEDDRHEERLGDSSQEDEEYDDDYDDNDLMNSVILSSKKQSLKFEGENLEKRKRNRSERESTEERESESKSDENRLDWRADLKKRLKSGSNTFNDSKNNSIISQNSDDEEDYILDIDVDMGVESTYDDDGYRDESDDHSPNTSSVLKTKNQGVGVIELDSSPEKSPRKPSRNLEEIVHSKDLSIQKNERGSLQNIQDSPQELEARKTYGNEEAVENTIVPIEKMEVPIDDKNDIIEKPVSQADIPKEKDVISELPTNNLNNNSKVPNEDNNNENEKTKDDPKPIEIMDFANEVVVPNSPKSDLIESTNTEHESRTSRINKRRRSSLCSIEEDEDFGSKVIKSTDHKDQEDEGLPAKKLKAELDTIFPKHNEVLSNYINKTSNETVENIQCHINQLLVDIQTLNDMIKANENEWNNMIYLKKMKEEICIRLTRKKQTIQLESKKIGDISALFNDLTSNETLMPKNEEIDKQRGPQLSSTPLHNKNNSTSNQHLSEQVSNILHGNSKSFSQSAANMIIQNRANMKSSELAKEKLNMQKVHSILVSRNILPKPTSLGSLDAMNLASSLLNGPASQHQGILNNYLTSSGLQHLGEILNGHATGNFQNGNQPLMIGRQGVFKDVKSIIADYRQQHPESVPRRGRRVKQSSHSANSQYDSLKNDTNSRPSSNDSSSHSMSNAQSSQFTDFLVQLNKMTGQIDKNNQGKLTSPQLGCSSGNNSGTYPEVTLHPVAGTTNDQAGSLLHGILTKNPKSKDSTTKISSAFSNNFSPTLAKLLTAPEKMGSSGNNSMEYQNISKVVGNNSEITITPVLNSSGAQHSLLQQHLHSHHLKELISKASANDRIKTEFINMDDEADDSVDRLVIDEGADGVPQHDEQSGQNRITSQAIDENDVPFCQGCKKHEAQFVCAGCGNQWYCSRDCQVTAWDDHSEVCTG
ncbi:hypothetical protein ACFFRR_009719 [Megaselia abdita]